MMKLNPLWLAVAGVGLIPAAAAAQPEPGGLRDGPPPIHATGTDIFRYLFDRADVQPLSDDDFDMIEDRNLDDVILVIIGYDRGFTYLSQIERVLRSGGAVLIAVQSHQDLNRLLPSPPGWTISGEEVECGIEGATLGGRAECPFAVPLEPPGRTGPEWQLFQGLNRVATNRPGFFQLQGNGRGTLRNRLAGFPEGSRVEGRKLDPEHQVLVVGASRRFVFEKDSRFLGVADPSVFVNEMMVPILAQETDNLVLADRVVQFLCERRQPFGPPQRRTQCLFVHNGSVMTDFSSLKHQLAPPPPPIRLPNLMQLQEKIVDAGNQIIDRFEENGGPSSLVMGRSRSRSNYLLRRLLTGLLVIGSICAVWFLVRRVWGARQPTDVPPAPPGGRPEPPAANGAPVGVFQRRQREILRRNNLYEPVRMALREFFAGTGAPSDGPKLPKVVIADTVRRADTLRKALSDLWRIAYGSPTAVTIQKWKVLEPLFDRVQQAHADGKWRFVVAEASMAARGSEA
jgi:hypothetical protein